MSIVKLGDVAVESRETCKGDKSGLPIVGLEHITPEEVMLSNWATDTENTFTKMFRKGDMLFGRRRAYLKKAAQAPFDGICSGDITVIRAKTDKLLPDLLPFIIQNDDLFDFAVGKSAGSLSPRVKWENLKNYTFNLPILDEQKKLVEVLWAINDTLQAYQKLLGETDELVKSQFIEMFGGYPKERFGDFCTTHARIGWQKLTRAEFLDAGNYYLVTGWDIMPDHTVAFEQCKYVTKERYEQDPKLILSKGDVLLTKDGTLGKVAIIDNMDKPATLNGHIFVIRPKDERVIPEFLLGLFISDDFINQLDANKTGSTIKGITQKALLEFEIPVAPVDVQRQYVKFMNQVNKSKFALQNSIAAAQATKRSLITDILGLERKE
jgi:type I restriction enzyme S subunit